MASPIEPVRLLDVPLWMELEHSDGELGRYNHLAAKLNEVIAALNELRTSDVVTSPAPPAR